MSKNTVLVKMNKLKFSPRFIQNYFATDAFNVDQKIKTCYRSKDDTRLIFIDSKIQICSDESRVRRFLIKEIYYQDMCLCPDEMMKNNMFDTLKEAQKAINTLIPNLIKMV